MIIGNGVDIVSVKKIEKAVKRWGDSFLNKVFHPQEINYLDKGRMYYQRLAARFAAKEAVIKSLGKDHSLFLRDVIIERLSSGAPVCSVLGIENVDIVISLTHIEDYAVATAIAQKKV